MAYVTPSTVSSGNAYTAAAHNIIVNDVIALSPGHLILTTTERNALSGPLTGMEIYNTTTGAFEMYNGSSWQINRPFAVASGTASITTSGLQSGWYWASVSVTLPTSRFTVAPIINVSPQYSASPSYYPVMASIQSGISTSSFSFWVWTQASQSFTVHWHAYQMTSTSATG